MAAFFVDSSALVKRYVREPGTLWVRALSHRGAANHLYVARVTAVEVASAIARRRNGGSIGPALASSMLYRFRNHLAGRYTLIELTPTVAELAMKLANTRGLRAYDAVQLAASLEINRVWVDAGLDPVTLVSSDDQLNAAATLEGLIVDNPRSHP